MNRLFRSSSSVSSRSSMTSIPDFINQEEHSYGNVSQAYYSQTTNQSEDNEQQLSPTQSDFETKTTNHQLRVINKEINWKILIGDFNSKENKSKRHQFRENHSPEEREKVVKKWKKFVIKEKLNITFYKWYSNYYVKCNVLTKTQWIKEDKTKVSSSHPPVETIIIPVKNEFITASPFKDPDGKKDEKRIVEQNNYTNQYLVSIGKQLDKIEEKFEDKVLVQSQDIKTEKPLVNLPQNRQGLGLPNTDQELVKTLDKLFKKFDNPESSKSLNIIDKEEDSSADSDSTTISKIENQFNKLSIKQPNPTSLTKNWYSRPTPPDLQFEERNLNNQFSVSSNQIYEWNIDGVSEHEVLIKLNHMSMVANSYITNYNNLSQPEIVEMLVSGFTGILRSWWDNHLTTDTKESIIHAVQRDNEGNPIFNIDIGMGPPDGINTLIYTIIKHFIRTPSNITERIHDQLSNLTCPSLSDFRWYKDVFTSRVMMREDSNNSFWKEKFVNGLPNLFAHKIREELSKNLGFIDYDNLTYGDIISQIQKTGLKMCIDFKISKQVNKYKNKAKYEL